MLSLCSAALSFTAGPPMAAPTPRAGAIAMGGTVKPGDFPVKNVWTSVCSSKDLKVSERQRRPSLRRL